MLPLTPLLVRPKLREWLIAACVTSLVTLLLWIGFAYWRDPHYPPEFAAGLEDFDARRFQEAQNLFDNALRTHSAEPDLYLQVCDRAGKAQQWTALVKYARNGLQNCPTAPIEVRLRFMIALITGLSEAKPTGWQDETLKIAKQAYDLAPNEPEIQNLYAYNLADLRGDPGSLKQAQTILTTALQNLSKQPESDGLVNLRAATQDSYGWTRCKQGDFPAAIDAFNRAISEISSLSYSDKTAQDNTLKTIYYHLGVAQRGNGDLEAARSAFRSALGYDANYAEAKAELAALKG